MRIFRVMLIFGLCLVFLPSSALAEMIPLQLPEDADCKVCDVLPDGTLIACGGRGSPMDRTPVLYKIKLDGSVNEITPAEDTYEGSYRDIICLDEDSYVLVRDVPNDPEYREYIGRIDAGKITWRSEPIANLFFIDCVDGGLLMTCKPQPVTAEIRRMDFDGNEIWKLRFDERMVIKGVLTGDGVHVAYGMVYEDPQPDNRDQRFTSLLFAFDDNGKLLWRHDGDELGYSTDLIDAAWAGNDAVIAISQSSAYKFDASGELWSREFDRFANKAIVELNDERCMVVCAVHHEMGMPLRLGDGSEVEWKEVYLPEISLSGAEPLRIDDELYLVLNSGMKGAQQLVRLDLAQLNS